MWPSRKLLDILEECVDNVFELDALLFELVEARVDLIKVLAGVFIDTLLWLLRLGKATQLCFDAINRRRVLQMTPVSDDAKVGHHSNVIVERHRHLHLNTLKTVFKSNKHSLICSNLRPPTRVGMRATKEAVVAQRFKRPTLVVA